MKHVPDGAQNLLEWLVESLYDFLEGIIGPQLVKRTFWFFAHDFHLHPLRELGRPDPGRRHDRLGAPDAPRASGSSEPLFRGANADLNMTLAMALVFFACWIVWALQESGRSGFQALVRAQRARRPAPLKVLMVVVFLRSGCLEVISILFRPISLELPSLRQYLRRRKHAGDHGALVPGFGWLLPVPFYFMELLVGLVQALVFMLLTAVFTMLICQHDEEPRRSQSG